MSTTLYEKRGRRYFPVAEYDSQPYWMEGHWHLHVQPGIKTSKRLLDPDFVAVEAAFVEMLPEMREAMLKEAKRVQPAGQFPETVLKRHEKAWAAYRAEMGDEYTHVLQGASFDSILEAGLAVLRKRLKDKGLG